MLRSQFPFFSNNSNIYLDSAASTQKPQVVIDAITNFYSKNYSSNHGVHELADNTNYEVESCRNIVAQLINAKNSSEIIFTSGATESFNLIADTITVPKNKKNILVCIAEHHSNLLPWQRLALKNDLGVRYFGITEDGQIDMQEFENKIDRETFLVAISHCSNVLGVVNDVKNICEIADQFGALSVVDATQSVVHTDVDVQDLNCDFLAFSGHKIYGPTGIGVLYGKFEQLEKLNNYKIGGEMVELVTKEKNYWKTTPHRFEAGTINLAGIIGLKAALKWFMSNKKEIFEAEDTLSKYTLTKLSEIKDLQFATNLKVTLFRECQTEGLTGVPSPQGVVLNSFQNPLTTQNKEESINRPIISFTIPNVSSYDLAEYLNLKNISVRVGQHCTGLLHEYLGIDSSLRISLACYNTREEIDLVVKEIKNGIEKLK